MNLKALCFLFSFFVFQLLQSSVAYQFNFKIFSKNSPRLQKLQRVCEGIAVSTIFTVGIDLDAHRSFKDWSSVEAVNAKVISAPRCDAGQGDGCEALAANSEFLLNLQKRSAENYERDMKQYLNTYNYNNFKDYFRFKGLELVRHPSDGSFEALTKAEIAALEKEGKIKDLMFVE